MKRLILLILGGIPAILLAANLSIPVSDTAYKNPNLHQAIYALLSAASVQCDGLITDLQGRDVIVVNPSASISITSKQVDSELVTVDSQVAYNNLVNTQITTTAKASAITTLKATGKVPSSFTGN
jgi:hypothetical protein